MLKQHQQKSLQTQVSMLQFGRFKGLTPKSGPGRREEGGGLVEEGERKRRCGEGGAGGVGDAGWEAHQALH